MRASDPDFAASNPMTAHRLDSLADDEVVVLGTG